MQKKWPTMCMARTVANRRCGGKSYNHQLENGRKILLCKLHDYLRFSPEKIEAWPEHSPEFYMMLKEIKNSEVKDIQPHEIDDDWL